MARTIAITLNVSITDEADPEVLAERLFDFLAADDDDVFPEIETVDGYDVDRPL